MCAVLAGVRAALVFIGTTDVWHTTSWDKRHFAEGLGFWEVSVFKAFTFWCQTQSPKKMPHADFRARLA